ncbi:MAG: DUF5320 domain-containing protein [Candidatus Gracilibacteria bacterium]|nr:DUF5320 domain-containing protein [Candidatus Gracilibacteria bacterium]
MPNFDGTGPEGKGPMTGNKRGKCIEENNLSGGKKFGRGQSKGRGAGCERNSGRGLGQNFMNTQDEE